MEDFTSKHTFIRKATPLEGKLTPQIHICGWFPPRIGVARIFSGGAFFPFPLKSWRPFLSRRPPYTG